MIKRLFPLFLFFLVFGTATAQTPMPLKIDSKNIRFTTGKQKSNMMCGDAGEISSLTVNGQSNDTDGVPIVLCFGDELTIDHLAGSEDLSNDPNPSTPSGIGYIFYECEPDVNIMGDNLEDLYDDMCLFQDPFFLGPDAMTIVATIDTTDIWLAAGGTDGDAVFVNDGSLNTGFNGGDPATFWFAPVTLNQVGANGNGFETPADSSNPPAGTCINVRTDQAFSVTYLNEITIEERVTADNGLPCRGRFTVRGGLPELTGGDYVSVEIYKEDDPSVEALILSGATEHGETVTFSVNQPGNYVVNVSDGKNCSSTRILDLGECKSVDFAAPTLVARLDGSVCMDITTENFDSLFSFQFSMQWDQTIVQFDSITNINPALSAGFDINTMNATNDGNLVSNWFTQDDLNGPGLSFPDGTTIFTLCFSAIGVDGECSEVAFTQTPTPYGASDANGQEFGITPSNGKIIISDNSIGVAVDSTNITCNGLIDGTFTVTVVGGTPPYNFVWNEVGDTDAPTGPITINMDGGSETVMDLAEGIYSITVTDSTNPMDEDIVTISIEEPGLLSASINATAPTCAGDEDATATVMVARGDNPPTPVTDLTGYSFEWNMPAPPNNTTQTISDLPAGFYSVTVTDPNGCIANANTVIADPIINADKNITDATCSGVGDGSVIISLSGGSGNYKSTLVDQNGIIIFEDVMDPDPTVGGLTPQEYCLTTTDDNGCIFKDSIIISASKVLALEAIDSSSVQCNGGADGFLEVRAFIENGTSPTLPWTFSWERITAPAEPITSNNNNDISRVENLSPGTYIVYMTDSDPAGCELIQEFTISEPEQISATDIQTTAETCIQGGEDGTATIAIEGGVRPYTLNWTEADGSMMQTDTMRTGLAAGPYDVTIQDANNCEVEVSLTVGSPTPPTVTVETDTLNCFDSVNGSLTAVALPGSAPVGNDPMSYMWTDLQNPSNTQNGATITNLMPGLYEIKVTAEDECMTIDTGLVFAPSALMLDSVTAVSPSCPEFADGQVTVFISGGTMPYDYSWSNGDDTNLTAGLIAGSYILTVTDANGCTPLEASVPLVDPPSIEFTVDNMLDVTCNGGIPCDGSATVTAFYSDGSAGDFNFEWASGENAAGVTTTTAIELCQGYQQITITDGEICSISDSVLIGAPLPLNADLTQTGSTLVTCFGDTDGTATIAGTGGVSPYTYEWQGGQMSTTITDQAPGEYSVTITDANMCDFEYLIEIGEPDSLFALIQADTTSNVTCPEGEDGVILVNTVGGNSFGNDAFQFSPNVPFSSTSGSGASALAENLPVGTYQITVTDVNGCTDTTSYTVSEPPAIIANIPDIPQPLCFGFQTFVSVDDVTGGNGPLYTFTVNSVQQVLGSTIPIFVDGDRDSVTVSVSDGLGCSIDTTLFVTQPREVQVLFNTNELEVQLGDSMQLNPTPIHDFPIDTYVWTPTTALSDSSILNPFIRPIESNEYNLTITDINGCVGSGSIFIDVDKNRNVYIPNAFSPNADGFNDAFKVFTGPGVRKVNYIRVFDRWGELVYQADDNTGDVLEPNPRGIGEWDGRVDNKVLNPGVFVYIIEVEFEDDITLLYRGDVTILD